MKIKIVCDYRKLMALGVPQDEAIALAATTVVDAIKDEHGSVEGSIQVRVKSQISNNHWWINEKLGKVRLFKIVCQ